MCVYEGVRCVERERHTEKASQAAVCSKGKILAPCLPTNAVCLILCEGCCLLADSRAASKSKQHCTGAALEQCTHKKRSLHRSTTRRPAPVARKGRSTQLAPNATEHRQEKTGRARQCARPPGTAKGITPLSASLQSGQARCNTCAAAGIAQAMGQH
jgi:hypothetical protein